jgi:hypothetical protein
MKPLSLTYSICTCGLISSLLPFAAAAAAGAAACSGPELGLGPEKVRREIQLQARLSHVNIVELKQVRCSVVAV